MQTDRKLRDSGKTKRQLLLEVSRLRRKLAVLDQDHERELEQAERIHTVIDLAAFGVLIADADHRIAYVNEHLCKVLGYRSQEMIGQSLTLLSPRSDQDSLRAYAKALRSVGFLEASEQVLRCKCGANVPFLLAGAKTVLASLWSVPDLETKDLMVEFYRRYLFMENISKSEALRQAQLAVIEQLRKKYGVAHPAYWGAFVCIGEL